MDYLNGMKNGVESEFTLLIIIIGTKVRWEKDTTVYYMLVMIIFVALLSQFCIDENVVKLLDINYL